MIPGGRKEPVFPPFCTAETLTAHRVKNGMLTCTNEVVRATRKRPRTWPTPTEEAST
jgi:hypothetical protein